MSHDEPIFDDLEPERRLQRRQYRLITDLVFGPNVRWKDNFYQALAILICLVLGAGLGALSMTDFVRVRVGLTDLNGGQGALFGGLIGLIVGLFGSGIFLMMYRALAHARGRDD